VTVRFQVATGRVIGLPRLVLIRSTETSVIPLAEKTRVYTAKSFCTVTGSMVRPVLAPPSSNVKVPTSLADESRGFIHPEKMINEIKSNEHKILRNDILP
jgi:hypothetical protein